jgi:hypothetical protein
MNQNLLIVIEFSRRNKDNMKEQITQNIIQIQLDILSRIVNSNTNNFSLWYDSQLKYKFIEYIILFVFFPIVEFFHLKLIIDQIDELTRLPLPCHFLSTAD